MKRVLFVINQLYTGGAERSLINILHSSEMKGCKVDLVVYDHLFNSKRVDLTKNIPGYVRIHIENPRFFPNLFRKIRKVYSRLIKREVFSLNSLEFVRGIHYDVGVSFGEWFLPEFLVYKVSATKKVAWIHTDISKAGFFKEEQYFYFDQYIDQYVFVSSESKKSALDNYRFLDKKSIVIHNIVDKNRILESAEEIQEEYEFKKPVLLTVGNIRPEKNHLLQVEVFRLLKEQGFSGTWINLGSMADENLVFKIKQKINEYGFQKDFLLLGAKDNPYPYMKRSDLIVNLSDFESWSMVITEALILNKMVVSTDTSGAKEQIVNGLNGYIVSHDASEISSVILKVLDKGLNKKVEIYKTFDFRKEVCPLLGSMREHNKYLYIIDDINYRGGAHLSTFNQIRFLYKRNIYVDILSETCPSIKIRNLLYHSNIYNIGMNNNEEKLLEFLESYQTVIVMSEGSVFRRIVAKSNVKNKVQYIHTNYSAWSNFNRHTKKLTLSDGELYSKYSAIVFVSENSRKGFCQYFPALEEKTQTIRNVFCEDEIKRASKETIGLEYYVPGKINIITIARLEEEKGIFNIVDVARGLKEKGINFVWNILGEGSLRNSIEGRVCKLGLQYEVRLCGHLDNPYPLLSKSDIFVLFSSYEGTPNTIYEAFILGVPVVANDVGGINEQVQQGVDGQLIDVDTGDRIQMLKTAIENLSLYRLNLLEYKYDNETSLDQFSALLNGRERQ